MKTKLNFIQRGKRFFFITLVTQGRRPILSRRAADKIVEILPSGERIRGTFAALHRQNTALTASNSILMPDHLHFILIVDFDQAPSFNIVEWLISFKNVTGGSDIWSKELYFQLSFSMRQLTAVRRYIRMNPARAHWKETHPDRFRRHGPFPLLIKESAWYGIGCLPLLASPFLVGARLARAKTAAEHASAIAALLEKAKSGAILVSGFISKGEQEVLARLRATPSTRFIRMVPYGLAPNYDPTVEDSRALAEGRELILTAFPPAIPAHPITRANCLEMNALIEKMCQRAKQGEFIRA